MPTSTPEPTLTSAEALDWLIFRAPPEVLADPVVRAWLRVTRAVLLDDAARPSRLIIDARMIAHSADQQLYDHDAADALPTTTLDRLRSLDLDDHP